MKKLTIAAIFIIATALNIFVLSWAYEHMDSYTNPTSEVEVRDQVKKTYIEADRISVNTTPMYNSSMKVVSFGNEQSDNSDLLLVALMTVFLYFWILL